MKNRNFKAGIDPTTKLKTVDIGGITVTHIVDGVPRSFTIRPEDFRCRVLTRELAEEWFRRESRSEPTRFGPDRRRFAIRSFCLFIDEKYPDIAASVSLRNGGSEFVSLFYEWERSLVSKLPATSSGIKRRPSEILELIRQRHSAGLYVGETTLLRTESGASFGTRHGDNQLPEYSREELKIMMDCARWDIRRIRARHRKFHALADAGSDPYEAGWSIENLLWRVRKHGVSAATLKEIFQTYGAIPAEILELAYELNIEISPTNVSRIWTNTANVLNRSLMVTEGDLIPYTVLLLYKTGITHSELMSMTIASLQFDDQGVAVDVVKSRAHRHRKLKIEGNDRDRENPWSGVSLLMEVKGLTNLAREEGPTELGNFLWVAHYQSHGRRFVKRVEHRKNRLAHWTKDNELNVTSPSHWGRFRKSNKSVRSRQLGNVLDVAGSDHSSQVFVAHYASTATMLESSGKSIIRSTAAAFESAIAGPQVLAKPSAFVSMSINEVDKKTQHAVKLTSEMTPADRSASIGTCVDPTNSPEGGRGMCSAQVRLCLVCPNALIFEDHLPQILILQEHLGQKRKTMNPAEFHTTYGQMEANILAIIDSFSNSSIDAAKEKVASSVETLSIPLSMKVGLTS